MTFGESNTNKAISFAIGTLETTGILSSHSEVFLILKIILDSSQPVQPVNFTRPEFSDFPAPLTTVSLRSPTTPPTNNTRSDIDIYRHKSQRFLERQELGFPWSYHLKPSDPLYAQPIL